MRGLLILAGLIGFLLAVSSNALAASPSGEARFTSETLTIDGELSEDVWSQAIPVPFLIPVSHDTPVSKTKGMVCWDDQYLYVGFEAQDEDLKAIEREKDGEVWRDDVLEVFVMPESTETPTNVEINVLGSMLDGNLGKTHRDFNITGLKKAISVRGTINDSSDRDEGWTLEVAIPFTELPGLMGPPNSGDVWRFHLARYDWSEYLPGGRELSSTAPLSRVNFHLREEWIPLRFGR